MAIQKLDQLPLNEETFEIDVEKGVVTGQRFTGKFKCICVMTLGQKAEAEIAEKRLNAGLTTLSNETNLLHMVIGQLSQRLIAAPDWWINSEGGRKLMDNNVLVAIFQKCLEKERIWMESVWGAPEEPKKQLESTDKPDDSDKKATPGS